MIVINRASYDDRTHLQNWSRRKPADWGDHGDDVFLGLWGCVKECLLSKRRRQERRSIKPLVFVSYKSAWEKGAREM
jgi:hypothetical protein